MIDTIAIHRPRVLLLAFMCSPDHGSEWGVGWNWALQSAQHSDTWVICRGDGQDVEIKRYLEKNGPIPGLKFEFVSYQAGRPHPSQVNGLSWLTYRRWHRAAFDVARRLHETLRFDLIHQVTNTGYREPGYLWQLDAPFVWGPVGGIHNYPWQFLLEAGPFGFKEAARSLGNSLQLNWSRRGHQAACRASAMLVSNSTGARQFHRAHGIHPIPMLETGIMRVAEEAPAPRGKAGHLRILWSGQFIPCKALSLLLKALAKLPSDVTFELRVLGAGPLERRWKTLADRLGIAKHIEWLGWLPYVEAQRQNEWADVFAFSSLRDNSGNVVLEAMANGIPIICLDHQGVADIVTDDCGLRVPVSWPQQVVSGLCDAVQKLARDPALRQRMSLAALERARQYLWPKRGDEMRDVYQRVLSTWETPDTEDHYDGGVALRPAPSRPHFDLASSLDSSGGANTLSTMTASDEGAQTFEHGRLRSVALWAAQQAAVGLHRVFGDRPDGGFGILNYHRVAEHRSGVAAPTWNVTAPRLRAQLEGLLSRGFEAWPLEKILAHTQTHRKVPANVFAVTFDDGYENNLLHALPVLKELQVPATFFLATGFLDSDRPFPFDDWSAAGSTAVAPDSWRPLSTAECHEVLATQLVDLGTHTHTHRYLAERTDEFLRDLTNSVQFLRERFGIARPALAFPFGLTNPGFVDAARLAGVSCALSTQASRVTPGTDPFHWGRFNVSGGDTADSLAAKLHGWYTRIEGTLRALKRPIAAVAPKAAGRRVAIPQRSVSLPANVSQAMK